MVDRLSKRHARRIESRGRVPMLARLVSSKGTPKRAALHAVDKSSPIETGFANRKRMRRVVAEAVLQAVIPCLGVIDLGEAQLAQVSAGSKFPPRAREARVASEGAPIGPT